jgi:ATP-dependent exoDNAse (exonuclease V) alpha subunit
MPVRAEHTPCQRKFFNVACSGVDVFLAGSPGTGKTYATEQIARHWLSIGDKVIVTATTGRAVMNLACMFEPEELHGVGTLNSVLRLGLGFGETERLSNKISDWDWANILIDRGRDHGGLVSLLRSQNMSQRVHFIIDEVSMLDARLLWVIVSILRSHNPGIQILLVGDGNQLQPVSDSKDPATPFWQTPKFKGFKGEVNRVIDEFTVVNLKTNVRQAEDPALKEALDYLAETNELSGVILERLSKCINGELKPPPHSECTHIRHTNITVERINKLCTDALNSEKKKYSAEIRDNTASGKRYPSWLSEFSPIQAEMILGVGMPVKLRKNRKNAGGALTASNGSRGFIKALFDDHVTVEFEDGLVDNIGREVFEASQDKKGKPKGKFTQLPLHPDYATTCHSCQGLTIKNPVVIGVYQENRVFHRGKPVHGDDGQVKTVKAPINNPEWLLVACSRVTSSEQLFFDVEDSNAANLIVASMGSKDNEYFNWLKEVAV